MDDELGTLLRDNPADLSTRFYLAGTRMARKDYKGAIEQYEKLLQQDPKNIVALNDLAWSYQQEKDKRALATAEQAYQESRSAQLPHSRQCAQTHRHR